MIEPFSVIPGLDGFGTARAQNIKDRPASAANLVITAYELDNSRPQPAEFVIRLTFRAAIKDPGN